MMLASLRFRREHCTRFRFRYSECDRCAEACPHEAVTATDEGVAIDGDRCRNCGLCAAACPTEALLATNVPRMALLAGVEDKARLSFACGPSAEAADAIVPCLGAIDAVTLVSLGRRGVEVELRGSHHCGSCEHGPLGGERMALALEGLERLRAASLDDGWPRAIVAQAAASGSGAAVQAASAQRTASRRHLFRRFLGRGVDAVVDAAQPPEAPVPSKAIRIAAPVASERRELLRATWPRDADLGLELEAHASLPLAGLALDRAKCTSCEACARACPTAAIEVAETSTSWGIAFRAARCVACSVCVEACQSAALSMAPRIGAGAVAAKAPVALHALPKKRCTRCDRFFLAGPQEDQCPTCRGDDEDFDALFG